MRKFTAFLIAMTIVAYIIEFWDIPDEFKVSFCVGVIVLAVGGIVWMMWGWYLKKNKT